VRSLPEGTLEISEKRRRERDGTSQQECHSNVEP
jgi:hypothetical protein